MHVSIPPRAVSHQLREKKEGKKKPGFDGSCPGCFLLDGEVLEFVLVVVDCRMHGVVSGVARTTFRDPLTLTRDQASIRHSTRF